jgi:hypothetical protein
MKASVSMQESKLQVLVLYDMQAPVPSTIKDHLMALVEEALASEVALLPRRSFTPYDAVSFKRDRLASSSVFS